MNVPTPFPLTLLTGVRLTSCNGSYGEMVRMRVYCMELHFRSFGTTMKETQTKTLKRKLEEPDSGTTDEGVSEPKRTTRQRLSAIMAAESGAEERTDFDYLNPKVADRQFAETVKFWSRNANEARQKEREQRSSLFAKQEGDVSAEFCNHCTFFFRVSGAENIDTFLGDDLFDDETFMSPDPSSAQSRIQYVPVPIMYSLMPGRPGAVPTMMPMPMWNPAMFFGGPSADRRNNNC
uniref:Uncharacterized protein n=1 Tax=Steinernema glaseri TaxID=37863 RepID=A0A1I7Y7F7_9BILA